jgi:hypothetical protein
MSVVTPFRRPINWGHLRQDDAERIVRSRASDANTGRVIFTEHTWDRASEREFTREDIFQILRHGHCLEQPERNEQGEWQVIMVARIGGSRDAGAVTVILEDENTLIIRTVQWMDIR